MRGPCLLLSSMVPMLLMGQISVMADTSTVNTRDGKDAQDTYVPGGGFTLASTDKGDLHFKLFTYVRYLNTKDLNSSYTDAFGNTFTLDPRNDLQLNKVNIQFMGWILDRRLRYLAYVWTNNTAQGLGAQVVVGGNLNYRFHQAVTLGGGINALPGVRSTEGNFPYWLSLDNRLIAEEFFRPSYTTGIWAKGAVTKGVDYQVMVGNNLSQLGIDAGQLDDELSTVSASLGWNPTTGEFGKPDQFGDFDEHEKAATRLGVHFTYSDEDRQSQPGTQNPENSQIRLSDGSRIFTPGLFSDSTIIEQAVYQMISVDAGLKYKGFSVDAAGYWRTVDDLRGSGLDSIGRDAFHDSGYQVQVSAMLVSQVLQLYGGIAAINGEYGDPSEWRAGINFFPWRNQAARFNLEYIHTENSPVGALSLPYQVGGTGGVIKLDFMLNL